MNEVESFKLQCKHNHMWDKPQPDFEDWLYAYRAGQEAKLDALKADLNSARMQTAHDEECILELKAERDALRGLLDDVAKGLRRWQDRRPSMSIPVQKDDADVLLAAIDAARKEAK